MLVLHHLTYTFSIACIILGFILLIITPKGKRKDNGILVSAMIIMPVIWYTIDKIIIYLS